MIVSSQISFLALDYYVELVAIMRMPATTQKMKMAMNKPKKRKIVGCPPIREDRYIQSVATFYTIRAHLDPKINKSVLTARGV